MPVPLTFVTSFDVSIVVDFAGLIINKYPVYFEEFFSSFWADGHDPVALGKIAFARFVNGLEIVDGEV